MFVRGGRCTPRIRPGGGEESDGDGGGRDRGSGGDPGMVATAASGICSRAAGEATEVTQVGATVARCSSAHDKAALMQPW